jgi:hypothetical protein
MASLHEYFVKDGAQNLTTQMMWSMADGGLKLGEVTARLHMNFDANAKYISFFIPEMRGVECPEALVLPGVSSVAQFKIFETRAGA